MLTIKSYVHHSNIWNFADESVVSLKQMAASSLDALVIFAGQSVSKRGKHLSASFKTHAVQQNVMSANWEAGLYSAIPVLRLSVQKCD